METEREHRTVSSRLNLLSNNIAQITQVKNATVKKGEKKIFGKRMLT